MGKVLVRFKHLKERRIVENWPTLKRLQDKHNFPLGRLLGDNTRAWTEAEIDAWLDARPATREGAATSLPPFMRRLLEEVAAAEDMAEVAAIVQRYAAQIEALPGRLYEQANERIADAIRERRQRNEPS